MRISDRGLDLIRRFESYEPAAYQDTGGVWTIGWGHTLNVRPGDVIDLEQATEFLREDVLAAEREANRVIKVNVNQGMYDAIVSFEFNTGGLVIGSPPRPSGFLRAINDRRWADAGEQLVRWNMDNGRDLRGLCRRRGEEYTLFHMEPWPS
jgi:GH24 family phage-related lysozyme (muramidase)